MIWTSKPDRCGLIACSTMCNLVCVYQRANHPSFQCRASNILGCKIVDPGKLSGSTVEAFNRTTQLTRGRIERHGIGYHVVYHAVGPKLDDMNTWEERVENGWEQTGWRVWRVPNLLHYCATGHMNKGKYCIRDRVSVVDVASWSEKCGFEQNLVRGGPQDSADHRTMALRSLQSLCFWLKIHVVYGKFFTLLGY